MKALAIARANVRRMLRDRRDLFFVFALPVVIIVVMGLAFGGGGTGYIAIADRDGGPLAAGLVQAIEQNRGPLEIRRFASEADLRDAVRRNTVEMGLIIPTGYDAALRAGRQASLEYVERPEAIATAVQSILDQAVQEQAAVITAARYAAGQRGIPFEQALAEATRLRGALGSVSVTSETSGSRLIDAGMSGYLMGAQSQLVLFMFLTSMTAATQLIVSRQLGVSRRMFSTPTSASVIVIGELLGRFAIAMIQGLFIFVGTALVFGVKWGDPVAACAIIVAFGLVATGIAMLVGSTARNAEQAGSLGVAASMLLGAFGGAMVPPEVFPDVMRTLSRLTPHSWAIDAFRQVALHDAGIAGVLPQLGVLLGFAAVLLVAATLRFRRALTG
jgi:ABC-2 type transport system permease protein